MDIQPDQPVVLAELMPGDEIAVYGDVHSGTIRIRRGIFRGYYTTEDGHVRCIIESKSVVEESADQAAEFWGLAPATGIYASHKTYIVRRNGLAATASIQSSNGHHGTT